MLVGADIAVCGETGAVATAKLLDQIAGQVFTAGDNAYFQGSPQQFRDCYDPTWGRHKGRTWPVPGNHDYETAGAAGYFGYFGGAAGPAGLGYYRQSLGSWTIVGLNSEIDHSASSAQVQWLRTELTTNPTACTLAIWHRPLFTSGPNGDNGDMADVWRALYDNNADVIVNGHDHLYERFAPQDAAGRLDSSRGIRQFTVGTGGAPLYSRGDQQAQRHASSAPGCGKVHAQRRQLLWEFIPVDRPPTDSDQDLVIESELPSARSSFSTLHQTNGSLPVK